MEFSESVGGRDMGIADFTELTDVKTDGKNIYLVDAGTNRLVITDSGFELIKVIDGYEENGVKKPFGRILSVCLANNEIYAVDSGNALIIRFNADGTTKYVYGKPDISLYNPDYIYNPEKVAVDYAGNMYVIAKGISDGIIQLDEYGKFCCFIGAPKVVPNLADLLWRRFMTEEQISKMKKFIPTEYNSIKMDADGFMYVTSQSSNITPVAKLNSQGVNVIKTTGRTELNGDGSYADRLLPGKIRGRGNSTWEWYDKKPYRIKLDKKHKLLGLAKAKSWVLLANYRDVTDLMNTFVFELGRWMGLPYTNHTRYVELFVNDEYVGLYQLTEQIQQGESRVAVSDERGILLSLDTDDGPELSPGESNNVWTKVFGMPAAVKYPEDEQLTAARRDSIRNVFATLEEAINHQDYATASTLMDMESFVRYLIIQQLIYNVELSSPRSIYIHKDGDGPWTMGPLWDFDAGYDFDWSNMYSGHTFFSDYRETLLGSNPVNRNGTYKCSKFFTQLFGCKEFVKLYKDTWNQYAGSLMEHTWGEMERYLDAMRQGAMQREMQQWPIAGKTFEAEVAKMKAWLNNRVAYVGQLINNIPEPGDVTPIVEERLCGTVDVNTTMEWSNGYHQTNKVVVDRAKVLSLLGVESAAFKEALVTIVPLKTDGTVGSNGTNGTFGGWFNAQGNPGAYAQGHVYIEVFDDLFNWNCGLYKENCSDDTHTVTMQYQYPVGSCLCKVNVRVKFTINNAGGGHWWW